ncbi:Folate transporter 1, chloroplastic, partial [Cucurbita argyrosperma subsp. sororia]
MSSAPGFKVVIAEDPVSRLTRIQLMQSSLLVGWRFVFCTYPVWLVKTRMQLQNPLHQAQPHSGLYDAFRTILREESFAAPCKGIFPGLFLFMKNSVHLLPTRGLDGPKWMLKVLRNYWYKIQLIMLFLEDLLKLLPCSDIPISKCPCGLDHVHYKLEVKHRAYVQRHL